MSDMSNSPSPGSGTPVGADLRLAPNFDMLAGVALRVSVEVGSTALPLAELLTLAEGSVIELDRATDDLLDVYANGTLIAKGEVVSIGDKFGVKIAEVVAADRRAGGPDRRA